MLPRAAVLRRGLTHGQPSFIRHVHVENTVGNNMPFKYEGRPRAFAFKLAAFMIGGFSIPFLATAYQLRKASSA